jgi:hypothetical protein
VVAVACLLQRLQLQDEDERTLRTQQLLLLPRRFPLLLLPLPLPLRFNGGRSLLLQSLLRPIAWSAPTITLATLRPRQQRLVVQ